MGCGGQSVGNGGRLLICRGGEGEKNRTVVTRLVDSRTIAEIEVLRWCTVGSVVPQQEEEGCWMWKQVVGKGILWMMRARQ